MTDQIIRRQRLEYAQPAKGDAIITMVSNPISEDEYPSCIDIIHSKFNEDGSVSSISIRLNESEIARLGYWLKDMYKDGKVWNPKK